MITLGLASRYGFFRTLRHLFAAGTAKSSQNLREALATEYGAGVKNVALYHSGRSALTVALQSVADPEGPKQVILPGLTCIAVVRAVRAAGFEPVFCDIEPKTLSYNLKMLDNLAKVCYNGIIVVQNTLGYPCHVSKIETIARKYNLKIVEDLAHCAGRYYPDGRKVGTIGAALALSFGKGKAIDTITGGAVVILEPAAGYKLKQPTQQPYLSERLRDRYYPVIAGLARAFWRIKLGQGILSTAVRLGWVERSADTRLSTDTCLTHWQARLALRQLRTLEKTPLRKFAYVHHREQCLKNLKSHHYYFDELWYSEPVSPARYEQEADFPASTCPVTVAISDHIINIPTWYSPRQLARAYDIIDPYRLSAEEILSRAEKLANHHPEDPPHES